MVYLTEILKQKRSKLLSDENIQAVAYYYLRDKAVLADKQFQLSPQEQYALAGYKGQVIDDNVAEMLLRSPTIKGVGGVDDSVYKLCGLYLAKKEFFKDKLDTKFDASSNKTQYFITLIEPSMTKQLANSISLRSDYIQEVLYKILNPEHDTDITESIKQFINRVDDVIDLIILEDLEYSLLRTKYLNKDAATLVRCALTEFGNSVKKITMNRRKNHEVFNINDEYDVQDILYVTYKPIFPTLKEEDPIARVGVSSSKIDLIIREEGILIEVKMIKVSDANERTFIDDLKIDIQSYYQCKWLKKL